MADNKDTQAVSNRREQLVRKTKANGLPLGVIRQLNDADEESVGTTFAESDSDPAWSPVNDEKDAEDGAIRKRGRRPRPVVAKTTAKRNNAKSNILSDAVKGAGINEFYSSDIDDSFMSTQTTQIYAASSAHQQQQIQPVGQHGMMQQRQQSQQQQHQQNVQHLQPIQSLNVQQQQSAQQQTTYEDFKSGDFVVSRTEVFQDWPPIWRVDGRSLLQKFEPFVQPHHNKMMYRSISTYATWTSEIRRQYLQVKVAYVNHFQTEIHVELLRDQLCRDTAELFIENSMSDMLAHQDQFEVYIQTLISQALDANFLMEIMQERDEYFLSNVKTIDDMTAGRKTRLINTTQWSARFSYSIETWPCYNLITDLGQINYSNINCSGCGQRGISARLILYGQPYNPNTVALIQLDHRIPYDKDLMICSTCVPLCELLHKISHQKYLMYIECAKKVAEKNSQDATKNTTVILNELLADEAWLSQLFKNVRCAWAKVDQIERMYRTIRM